MLDTLLVPGLTKILWSVPALCAQGHDVIFGLSTIRLVLHSGTPEEFTIFLKGASQAKPETITNLPFPFAGAAFMAHMHQDSEDHEESTLQEGDDEDEASPPQLLQPFDMRDAHCTSPMSEDTHLPFQPWRNDPLLLLQGDQVPEENFSMPELTDR